MHSLLPILCYKAKYLLYACACRPDSRTGIVTFKLGKQLFDSLWIKAHTVMKISLFLFYFQLLCFIFSPFTKNSGFSVTRAVLFCNQGCGRSVLLPVLAAPRVLCPDVWWKFSEIRVLLELWKLAGVPVSVLSGKSVSLTTSLLCVGEDMKFVLLSCCRSVLWVAQSPHSAWNEINVEQRGYPGMVKAGSLIKQAKRKCFFT